LRMMQIDVDVVMASILSSIFMEFIIPTTQHIVMKKFNHSYSKR
ncbi:MAG: hypothetical protein RLZZ46_1592, partial [Bacteroidota bacterium]